MHTGAQKAASARTQVGTLLLALGGNMPGRWGGPGESISRACRELEAAGLRVTRASSLYLTEPVGGGRQPAYLNAVIMASGAWSPGRLLRLVKRIERRAGRGLAPTNQARPLDIDILDYGGRRMGWPPLRRERGRLILPHPLLHRRTFVLVPLLEIAPHGISFSAGNPRRYWRSLGPRHAPAYAKPLISRRARATRRRR
jgi:2-amino-4-hydroxy-6-hydroxymethyldihydropteridine diphosphokinase